MNIPVGINDCDIEYNSQNTSENGVGSVFYIPVAFSDEIL
jgi:hypothetical protein